MDDAWPIGLTLVGFLVLVGGVALGVSMSQDQGDPTADANVATHEPGDPSSPRSPGVTLAHLEANGTAYELTATGERTILEADAFELDRSQHVIDAEPTVTAEDANGAVLLEDAGTQRLFVAHDEYLELDIAPDGEEDEDARVVVYLHDPRTTVLAPSSPCEVSITDDGPYDSGPRMSVLGETGTVADVDVEGTGPCEAGTFQVTHLGTEWRWA